MAGLYLHIPFCEHKCIYCDFYSVESMDRKSAFIRSIKQEIASQGAHNDDISYSSIFFGGGTPSLLEPRIIGDLIELLGKIHRVEPDAEITLEANPGTVDRKKLEGYRTAGVNRLSFGVQSFHEDDLRFLTRIHTSGQAVQAVEAAREAGFGNVNLDLIFALPNQTMPRWETNLRKAIALEPDHISAYSLIVEPRTPLSRMVRNGLVSPLPLEDEAEMYEFTMQVLHAAGYEHYEVSNYSKPGCRSRHNLGYWNHEGYLGFGPSAHSFKKNRRWWNVSNLRTYCDAVAEGRSLIAGEEFLNERELFDEAVMLGLRGEGINIGQLRSAYGIDLLERNETTIRQCESDALLVHSGDSIRLTDKGYLLCDELCELLLSHAVDALRIPANSSILTPKEQI